MSELLHKNHRERVLNEFLQNGFSSSTPPHKVLEFLLFYCIPRKDTNELAHTLISRYGSISGVLDAPLEDLAAVKGLSTRSAALLKLIMPIANIYSFEKSKNDNAFTGIEDVGAFMYERLRNYDTERLAVLLFNADGRFKDFDVIFEGSVDSVGVSVRSLMKRCLEKDAVIVALGHNHPSGLAIPSSEDVAMTERIAAALSSVGIKLIDHVVVVSDDYVSMAQSPEYAHIFR